MSYVAKVQCDGCGLIVAAPHDGGFPPQWTELNTKPSFRGTQPADKAQRRHWCPDCMVRAKASLKERET